MSKQASAEAPWKLVTPSGELHIIKDIQELNGFAHAHGIASSNLRHHLGFFTGNGQSLHVQRVVALDRLQWLKRDGCTEYVTAPPAPSRRHARSSPTATSSAVAALAPAATSASATSNCCRRPRLAPRPAAAELTAPCSPRAPASGARASLLPLWSPPAASLATRSSRSPRQLPRDRVRLFFPVLLT
jgi:hypothetical protein